MAKLSYKISYYAFYACCVIILIAFAAFYLIGYDNMVGEYNSPKCTDVIMILMMALVVVTAVLTVWSGVNSLKESSGSGGKSINGVPGGKISLIAIGLLVVSLVIGFVLNLGEEAYTAADGTVTSGTMVTVTDMFLWSIVILIVAAAVATVVNMAGILKK